MNLTSLITSAVRGLKVSLIPFRRGSGEDRSKGIEWRRIDRQEGAMKSDVDSPSLWDIRRCLLSSVDFAEDYALSHPEHADAVTRFSQEIRKLKTELMSSFEGGSALSALDEIVNALSGARALVMILADRHPNKTRPLTRFEEGLINAQEKLIRNVRPEVYRPT